MLFNKFNNKWSRKLHRWGAVIIAAPLFLVIGTGLLLQVKKQVPWIQPTTQKGIAKYPQISFEQILESAKSVETADISQWTDIDRLDVRPSKGIVKIQSKNSWEIQLDLKTAEVLSTEYRRSDLIESLHDGSFFSDSAKLWLFLPNGLILMGLWITGAYLWYLPFHGRRAKAARLKKKLNDEDSIVSNSKFSK